MKTRTDYIHVQREFYALRRQLADYAERLEEASRVLRAHPQHAMIQGDDMNGAPWNVKQVDEVRIEGHKLPTAVDLNRVLVQYRGVYAALWSTWSELSPLDREGLEAPPLNVPNLIPAKS